MKDKITADLEELGTGYFKLDYQKYIRSRETQCQNAVSWF
jgi:hypothetical protein